jgi:hypothetical protein
MDNTYKKDFDYDYWSQLWKDDPEAFEIERKRFIERCIASVPEEKRQRLYGLQWRVDMERQRSKTPYAALLRLQKMMWESVLGENGLLDSLRTITESTACAPQGEHDTNIIRLGRAQKKD